MNTIHDTVKAAYGRIAKGGGSCCGPASTCCGGGGEADALAQAVGYSAEQLAAIPEGANLGLSCGNPTALAGLQAGEVVLDLGSGAGLDVFIAAAKVGATGHVHGVDMTKEMVMKARQNAASFRRRTGLDTVTFHHANIEAIPLPDASVDVVISNCVLNLSPDQPAVWREIGRVLKPGGRVSISDIVLRRPLPESVKGLVEAYVGCIAGASLLSDIETWVKAAGLEGWRVEAKDAAFEGMMGSDDPLYRQILAALPAGVKPGDYATSALLHAVKPR
ncbi:MAG TPA: arsenite methyltransferase [Holophagaceae bacterium]|nr:arsenite methyltransferase [Holophagaceae bacterium]